MEWKTAPSTLKKEVMATRKELRNDAAKQN